MKTTRNTHGLARLLAALLLAFCSATPLFAQAFDGSDDSKIYLGYTNVGGRHGVEIGYEEGINDFLSYGAKFTTLRYKDDEGEKESRFYDFSDIGIYLNYHFMEVLKLPDNFDIYVGPILSTKTMSLQTGVRYNFGEVFGVYGSAQYNFFETITIGSNLGVYPEKFAFSAGFTISI